jgi:hypothetical protein
MLLRMPKDMGKAPDPTELAASAPPVPILYEQRAEGFAFPHLIGGSGRHMRNYGANSRSRIARGAEQEADKRCRGKSNR